MPLFSVGIKAKRTDPSLLRAYVVDADTAVEAKKAVRNHLAALGNGFRGILRAYPAERVPVTIAVRVLVEPKTLSVPIHAYRVETRA